MMDYVEKSFASAADASKLLITLSTALIAFCATLLNVTAAKAGPLAPASYNQKVLLAAALALLVGCTACGVWTQLAITDVLSHSSDRSPATVWSRKITFPFMVQIVTFVVGVSFLAAYGVIRILV
jgi:hypothetical protein